MSKITHNDIARIALANPDAVVPDREWVKQQVKRGGGKNKYNAVRVEYDGIKFDSKREMARYFDLDILQRAGHISDLELQPVFELHAGVKYVADFRYKEDGVTVVEDVKGGRATQTSVFRMKWKQVQELHPDIEWRLVE